MIVKQLLLHLEILLGTEAQLCTESVQGRIIFDITYDGIVGITDIDILQKH